MVAGSFKSFLAEVLLSMESSPSKIMIVSDNAKGLRSPPRTPPKTRRASCHMPSYLPAYDTTYTVAVFKWESDSPVVGKPVSSQKVMLNKSSAVPPSRRHSADGKLSRWGNSNCDSKLQCDDLLCPGMS